MEALNKQIGNRVRLLREQKKMLQRELSQIAGLPVRTIGRIERGEVDVRISSLYKISKALEISIKDLF